MQEISYGVMYVCMYEWMQANMCIAAYPNVCVCVYVCGHAQAYGYI